MSDANSSGDSNELEALFDSIASGVTPAVSPVAAAVPPVTAKPSVLQQVCEGGDDDSADLQALFDSIASKQQTSPAQAEVTEGQWPSQDKVFQQVGKMTRLLHDTLGNLGFE